MASRRGGRRYLSEDLELLDQLIAILSEQVERIRSEEMQALVSRAELRALQAQINPHFFFNALNTLYGVIARENSVARRLVLNLSGLFRSSFAVTSALLRSPKKFASFARISKLNNCVSARNSPQNSRSMNLFSQPRSPFFPSSPSSKTR